MGKGTTNGTQLSVHLSLSLLLSLPTLQVCLTAMKSNVVRRPCRICPPGAGICHHIILARIIFNSDIKL
jgi:hypothetical protein